MELESLLDIQDDVVEGADALLKSKNQNGEYIPLFDPMKDYGQAHHIFAPYPRVLHKMMCAIPGAKDFRYILGNRDSCNAVSEKLYQFIIRYTLSFVILVKLN